jgi:predicted helicase
MSNRKTFHNILSQYRKYSFSERDKGDRFERLIQAYLQTDPQYSNQLAHVWMWDDFPAKKDFGGKDTGIDLVAKTIQGNYWAIQCKCFQESAVIDKPAVDSFLATSSKQFTNDDLQTIGFSNRIWVSTTNNWGGNAEATIRNQHPPVSRVNLHDLENAPVDWEKLAKGITGEQSRVKKKELRPHQTTALNAAHEHFKTADRGKLIMACGTGKTFTSLKIAEKETDGKGLVLFLVPSIALLGQTLREWSAEAYEAINAICICSDSGATKVRKKKDDDTDGYSVIDLAVPASTDVKNIVRQFENRKQSGMTVVFSTYQSIEVIAEAQRELQKKGKHNSVFDLIICDEAHRTTGVTLSGDDSSAFVKVHDNSFIEAKKRIYMTATPRLFNDDSKARADKADAILCSMDDEQLYGEEIYRIGFGEAVENDLLSDYKVLILTVSDKDVPPAVQKMVANAQNEINSDDASKLIGCINALSKNIIGDDEVLKTSDPLPMRRAVAFCQNIATSNKIANAFNEVASTYFETLSTEARERLVSISAQHVDGAMSAPTRDEKLSWLKAETDVERECRLLSNVRCLSEGVDVPSLDAVLFLSARNSQVDVVQSVGRVMRKAEGKKYGYIIIPVVVPSDVEPEKALDDNDRYRVVWTVLNALRAHDDRFNATINKIELNKNKPSQILVGRPDNGSDDDSSTSNTQSELSRQLSLQFQELQSVVFARMVEKVGDRRYWEQWAKDVAQIAERHIKRITNLIATDEQHKKAFDNFLKGLHKNINPSITEKEAIEMVAQHIITKPVFEALFEGYSFVKNNPISKSIQQMIDLLEAQSIDKDAETLQRFYESVKSRAKGIDNAEGKQKIIIELYDKFFKTAFPKMVEKLGIVYTPVEVVDFTIKSIEVLLQREFGRSISDENIHLLDPFTGTGTFITRLLQNGLIKQKDLERKYNYELHANEIVLLAYYIAAINIENAYHDLSKSEQYEPFEGICLTDTFQLGETDDSEKLFSEIFPQNSKRVVAQKKAPLRVIMGNPPYSVGQKAANDNAQNQSYNRLDSRIAGTYVANSNTTMNKALYDAYIKAFRWSTDRLDPKNGGIIAFVSNGAWVDGNAASGFRKTIEKEFSAIYVFNLRGNARTQGELRRKEAGNVFDSGSRTPITITFLIKKPNDKKETADIYYHDIGDYLSREEKLDIISKFGSIDNDKMNWQKLEPNEHGDWLNQRNDVFNTFIPLVNDKDNNSFFSVNSNGVVTARDAWVYNFSRQEISSNLFKSLAFYNSQITKFLEAKKRNPKVDVDDVIDFDSKKISWSRALKNSVKTGNDKTYNDTCIVTGSYRPFMKQFLYFNRDLNECVYQQPKLFPQPKIHNRVIVVTGIGASKEFSSLIVEEIPNLHFLDSCQCFPLFYYEEKKKQVKTLFDTSTDNESDYIKRDGISDFVYQQAKKIYGSKVSKEDIFYYVYGLLHSVDYRQRFENDLKKMLPRIPLVDEPKEFWQFSKAGRALAELHLNYETAPRPDVVKVIGEDSNFYRVEKMRFASKDDKSIIYFNSKITVENIPAEAYNYVVNGKSAIEWIIERYQITINKDSEIKNDPNDYSEDPKYILNLLLSIITISLETNKIVDGLPKLR